MKAYAPSDRGTSAAVVVSQELLTAAVTGLQPTKEREKASIIFFVCQIFLLTAMVQPRREKASTMFFFCNTSYFVICPSCQESELWLQGEGKGKTKHTIESIVSFHLSRLF